MSYESGSAEAIAMAGARLPVSLPVRGLFRKDHGQGFPPWSFRFCSFQPADPTQEINLGERKGKKRKKSKCEAERRKCPDCIARERIFGCHGTGRAGGSVLVHGIQ